ncbi:MAG: PH domain-containing protein [Anaerolineae bacterium]|nr:PH domain-containing protein [Anaerolineae bacterium]MCB0248295.1 PH domain-containing protein [Anaerolineae bacterium]MCO5244229.1 PH domain-containing protein [Anaerolineae bacterium]HRX03258.1 PH domain-containing protein [Anaerolineae bacterium]
MTVEQSRERVKSSIWQSIAKSGVQIDAVPADQLDTLVNAITDGVLVAVDDMLEDSGLAGRTDSVQSPLADEEIVLWEGRPFLSLVVRYRITNQRVRIESGFLGKDRDDIELVRVQDIDHNQGIGERALGIGDVVISSADPSKPHAVLRNVRDPENVHEILRRAMLDARKRYRYSVQEEM